MQNLPHLVAVVEDDCAMRIALGRLLSASGYEVSMYHSAEEFLERATLEDFGCLLLDVNLPGMSGLDLQARLKDVELAPPIIFITAETDVFGHMRAVDNGCVAYFEKPVTARLLLPALDLAFRITEACRVSRAA